MADDTRHAAVVESLKATASELQARPYEDLNHDWADRMAEALAAAGLLAAPAARLPAGAASQIATTVHNALCDCDLDLVRDAVAALLESWQGASPAARPHVNETSTGGYLPRLTIPGEPMKLTVTDGGDGGPGMRDINAAFDRYMPEDDPAVDREALIEEIVDADLHWIAGPGDSPAGPTDVLNPDVVGNRYREHLADALIAAGYVCTPGHEWQCPGCGATTRARMADHPTERNGAAQIAAERRRVVTAKGYDAAHDDWHKEGQLVQAAAFYLNTGAWPWSNPAHYRAPSRADHGLHRNRQLGQQVPAGQHRPGRRRPDGVSSDA